MDKLCRHCGREFSDTSGRSQYCHSHRRKENRIEEAPKSIEIIGHFQNDRYSILVNNTSVMLSMKSFSYLFKLSWARLRKEHGWIHKDNIEGGDNQARYIYRMKNEIIDGSLLQWKVFESNRNGSYRLNIDPGAISIHFENLTDYPDYQIRTMAETELSEIQKALAKT